MDEDELEDLIDEEDLGVVVEDYDTEDEIRRAIAEELDIEAPAKKKSRKKRK